MRASGVMPSSLGLGVAHDDDGGGAVVERAGVAGGDRAVGAEHRLELGQLLDGGAGAGAVVLRDDGAVGEGDRGDLPVEEAALLGGDGPLLRAGGQLVHLLAGDALGEHDVLGRLAHGDVDVGEARRRRPAVGALRCARRCGPRRRRRAGCAGRCRTAPCRKRLTVSTPPATNTSPSPALMAWAAMRIVCSDDEQ